MNLVRFELARGGAVHAASLVFERVTPEEEAAPAVRIDAFGRTIVDGKPFFPLGMYWSKVDPRLIGAYREGPFNCLMPYHAPNRREMDLCASNGLKVIYNVVGKDLSDGAIVCRFRRHPALLAWYLNDERPISERDALARARTFAELHDPDHPGWIAIYQYYEVSSYLPTFDVVGTDPYPLYRNPIGMVTKWTRATRDGLMGLKTRARTHRTVRISLMPAVRRRTTTCATWRGSASRAARAGLSSTRSSTSWRWTRRRRSARGGRT